MRRLSVGVKADAASRATWDLHVQVIPQLAEELATSGEGGGCGTGGAGETTVGAGRTSVQNRILISISRTN